MSFFSFIDSIFYLSLGIIVILIFLIVFHFKQRIESLEKKGFLLTEMYNSLVREFSIIKTVVYSPPAVQQKQNILISTEPVNTPLYKKIVVMDKVIEEDSEEEEDSDSDSEEEEDADSEGEEVDVDVDIDVSNKLDMIDNEFIPFPVEEIESILKPEPEPEPEQVPEPESAPDVVISISEPESAPDVVISISEPEPEPESVHLPSLVVDYSKMNLQELKAIVVNKGFVNNANKLKRAEILKLLEEPMV